MISPEEKIHTGYTDGPEICDTKAKNSSENHVLTRISEAETLEFFNDGLKQAASAAHQLGRAQEHFIWSDISALCDHIRSQGMQLFTQKGLSWNETLKILDDRQNMTSHVLESKRPPTKKFLLK